jgi:hypothetical protein
VEQIPPFQLNAIWKLFSDHIQQVYVNAYLRSSQLILTRSKYNPFVLKSSFWKFTWYKTYSFSIIYWRFVYLVLPILKMFALRISFMLFNSLLNSLISSSFLKQTLKRFWSYLPKFLMLLLHLFWTSYLKNYFKMSTFFRILKSSKYSESRSIQMKKNHTLEN